MAPYIDTFKGDVLEAYHQEPALLSSRMVEYLKYKAIVDKNKKELKSTR